MSDCVYFAFADHLRYLGITPHQQAYSLFRDLKKATLPKAPSWGEHSWVQFKSLVTGRDEWQLVSWTDANFTYGGVVPRLITTLASLHGLAVETEHRLWTPDHYEDGAQTEVQQNIIRTSDFGKEVMSISLEPAIYLMLDGAISKHALFRQSVPVNEGVCVMALKLGKVSEDQGEFHEYAEEDFFYNQDLYQD